MTSRQELIARLQKETGKEFRGKSFDGPLKIFNNFEMSLSDRIEEILRDKYQFNKFVAFMKND